MKKDNKKINNKTRKLKGANMDIDLASNKRQISWKQDGCPWNIGGKTNKHKCAIKNTSICKYFKGIEYPDFVICAFK